MQRLIGESLPLGDVAPPHVSWLHYRYVADLFF